MNQKDRACCRTRGSHGFVGTGCRHECVPAAEWGLLGPEAKVQKQSEKVPLAEGASSQTALKEGVKCSGKGRLTVHFL